MSYLDPNCPECGQQASECVNTVMTHQPFKVDEHGEVEWGLSKPIWETETGDTDGQRREVIRCPDGHEWFSRIDGVDHDRPKRVSIELSQEDIDAVSALIDKGIEMLEFEGQRDDEENSQKIDASDRLQHRLTQALNEGAQ